VKAKDAAGLVTNDDRGRLVTTVLAEITRGGVVESRHTGSVVVADVSGTVNAWVGDPELFVYFRSSAKPLQAVPLIESGAADRFGFTPAELALCCASHSGAAMHQEQVLTMLGKLGLDPGALQCGAPLPMEESEAGMMMTGEKPRTPLACDCSGKHTGMLATCVHMGYPLESYLDPDHPVQQTIRGVIAETCRVAPDEIRLATDGCSVPTFGVPLSRIATAFATLSAPAQAPAGGGREHAGALDRLRAAMTAHPENVGGPRGRIDTDLMRCSKGRLVAKGGAEGLLCIGVPEHRAGIAIRVADGTNRAHAVAACSTLQQLGYIDRATIDEVLALHDTRILNHNRRHVGDIRAAFTLTAA
jgi:L-asparaginase II